ncbi:MAG: potassium channel family protein [Ardenticatenaceae bacterium]|nr:potassium channel family protein [Ardenticatenaceae bacterium]
MNRAESTAERLTRLVAQMRGPLSAAEREAILYELIDLHEVVAAHDNARAAQQVRQAFLRGLGEAPAIADNGGFRRFLAECIKVSDFSGIQWETADEVITIAEALYGFHSHDEGTANQAASYVPELLRYALRHFEQAGEYEKMLELLQRAPIPPTMMDAELLRLRNRLYLYERRRVQRKRRILYSYLIVQAILILIVFPLLFVHYENGEIEVAIEKAANVDLPPESHQYLSYADGLYWSVITAASIGYGDITPVTFGGRVIAATLGTMGVLTIGVIAGLILNWITPRDLD